MDVTVRQVSYFTTTVADEPADSYQLLSLLAQGGVSLLAFHAFPVGPGRTQMSLFPEHDAAFLKVAREAGLVVDGPHAALLVLGDDEMGVLARLHQRLAEAQVNVFACTGIADGCGRYGCLLYLRSDQVEQAVSVLGIA